MQTKTQTRAHARALVGAVAIGSTLGLALGGAYLAGGSARAAMADAQAVRIAAGPADTLANNPDLITYGEARNQDLRAAAIATAIRQGQKNAPTLDGFRKTGFRIEPAAKPFMGGGSRDLDCLTTAVYYEARGEGRAGQQAVAQVVLNRVRHPAFPKSVCGVVFQGSAGRGCQFSFACNGAMRGRKEGAAWRQARDVASSAMSGFVLSGVGNATHFHAARVAPGWGGMVRVAQVGAHVFYRFGGAAGRASSFRSQRVVASNSEAAPAYTVLGESRRHAAAPTAAPVEVATAEAPKPAYQVLGPTSRTAEPAAKAPAASPIVAVPVATTQTSASLPAAATPAA